MPTKVLLCDTADGLAQLQYVLIRSGAGTRDRGRHRRLPSRRGRGADPARGGRRRDRARGPLRCRARPTAARDHPRDARDLLDRRLPHRCRRRDAAAPAPPRTSLKEDGPDAVFASDPRGARRHRRAQPPRRRRHRRAPHRRGTARRELETTLAESHRPARVELTTAKADFLANVSHELRTPVTVAKGIAYVLKNRGIPEDEQHEFLGQLEASLEKLMMLVDEMLTIADLDRGTLSLKVSEVDLAPILRHVADEIEPPVPGRHDRTGDPRNAPRRRPTRAVHRGRPAAAGQCLPLLARGRGRSAQAPPDGRGRRRVDHRPRCRAWRAGPPRRPFSEPFSAGEDILRKERAGRRGRAPHGATARGPARRHPVGRSAARRAGPGCRSVLAHQAIARAGPGPAASAPRAGRSARRLGQRRPQGRRHRGAAFAQPALERQLLVAPRRPSQNAAAPSRAPSPRPPVKSRSSIGTCSSRTVSHPRSAPPRARAEVRDVAGSERRVAHDEQVGVAIRPRQPARALAVDRPRTAARSPGRG